MTPEQRIARAQRAKAAMEEFFAPALAEIESDYGEKMIAVAASSDPRAPDVIARLANGISVARQVRARIEAHIADGGVAKAEREIADAQDRMSASDRRLVNIGR